MPKMYELNEAYDNIAALLTDESMPEEELLDALHDLEGGMIQKVGGLARVIKNIDGDITAIKSEEKRLEGRRKAFESRINGLEKYIQSCMEEARTDKVKDALLTVALQLNPPSVAVLDKTVIPKKYWTHPAPELSKALIKQDLSAGVAVPGAELRQEVSLRIR